MAQMAKHLPTMRETGVQSLGWEDLLEKEMATGSSILAWKIPRTEEPGRLQSMGSQRVRRTEQLHFHFHSVSDSFVDHDGYSISSKGFSPTVVDIMVIQNHCRW